VKRIARVLALAGLVLAAALFAHENIANIVGIVMAAAPGLVLAGCFHVAPMLANAAAWRRLFPLRGRPPLRVLVRAVWIRESVNGVLPVARIGGEIAAYRILRQHVASRAQAAASLAADMALSVVSQSVFAAVGLCILLTAGHGAGLATPLLAGVGAMVAFAGGFVYFQRAGAVAGITAFVDRRFSGRLGAAIHRWLRLDRALRAVYERHADVGVCLAWQLAAWLLAAGELWLALVFLGHPRPLHDVIAIEALVQAISSAAFIVPGAIGIQEGAFVVLGAALGLDATTSLALASVRRLRDLVIYLPGLIAWHRAEISAGRAARAGTATPKRASIQATAPEARPCSPSRGDAKATGSRMPCRS
jgi:glycosyltransferase 2 family protein